MKKVVGLGALLASVCISALAQVDTSYIYNTSMPYGTLDLRIAKSATRYYYLQEDVTFSYRESSPGVKTNTFRDGTSWDSSPYKEGNLRERNGANDLFVMNYRVLFPKNYDPGYEPGYPIVIGFHGSGEVANCWRNNCKWATDAWNPNINDPQAPTNTSHQLLNNEKSLTYGGRQHMEAVNLAGDNFPNDESLPERSFPGLVVFPQSLNGWLNPTTVEDAIRIVRLMIKKYNIDENRVYIHGISMGGIATNQALKRAPWLFAGGITFSAPSDAGIADNAIDEVSKIPLWLFQGAKDSNPTTTKTFSFIKKLKDAGGIVRYTVYPNLGHATWNAAQLEPDFFLWMRSQNKTKPHVAYGKPGICEATGTGSMISYSKGFKAYQWEKDGVLINNATDAEYYATTSGVYRGRFSRVANPTESEWEPWSEPIRVEKIPMSVASIELQGTAHLRGPGLLSNDANNTVVLKSHKVSDQYFWYRNGELLNFSNNVADDTLRVLQITSGSSGNNGNYTLITKDNNCPATASDPIGIFFANSSPYSISLTPSTLNFKAVAGKNAVFLSWADRSEDESAYEIWRKRTGDADFELAGKTPANSISFLDTALESATKYLYKIRAVNNSGRSHYAPSDNVSVNYEVNTISDEYAPKAPQNLRVVSNTLHSISISWTTLELHPGIEQYLITYGENQLTTSSEESTFTITGLTPNTVYPITVRAVDSKGNISQPSNEVTGWTFVSGLNYKHSTGIWTDLDDSTLVATFNDPEIVGKSDNFSIQHTTQENYFNFLFEGYLYIEKTGEYTFQLASDDGSRLIINDEVILDNDGEHNGRTVVSEPLSLSQGYHTIEVQYFENSDDQYLKVGYKGPGIGDGNTFIEIPAEVLKTGDLVLPPTPQAPSNLRLVDSGIEAISFAWDLPNHSSENFEIFRADTVGGQYFIIATVRNMAFKDTFALSPGRQYSYKVRSIVNGNSSSLSEEFIASTQDDNIEPSVPRDITLVSQNEINAAISWSPSSDNIAVNGYEIFVNGKRIGNSIVPAYTFVDINTGSYTVTVVAVDLQGNKSAQSTAFTFTHLRPSIYYPLSDMNLEKTENWNTRKDGSGTKPDNFTTAAQTFIIPKDTRNAFSETLAISGEGSKLILEENSTLELLKECNCPIVLNSNSTLVIHEGLPDLIHISPTSTIKFYSNHTVKDYLYGNVIVNGRLTTVTDTLTVGGDLTLATNSAIQTKSGQSPILMLSGHLSIEGSASTTNLSLVMSASKSHSMKVESDVKIKHLVAEKYATIAIQATDTVSLTTGDDLGGGIVLDQGAKFIAGKHDIIIEGKASINSFQQPGILSISGGNLVFNNTSSDTSFVNFGDQDNWVESIVINAPASTVTINNTLVVQKGIKISNGHLHSRGNIVLDLSTSAPARIYEIEGNGQVSGYFSVQQPLAAESILHDYGVPFNNVTVASLQQSLPITGNFEGSDDASKKPSMFVLDYLINDLSAYPPEGTDNQKIIEPGRGYQVDLLSGKSNSVVVGGGVVQGHFKFSINPDAGDNPATGWNFLANPFPSPVLLNKSEHWKNVGLSNIVAVKSISKANGKWLAKYNYYDISSQDVLLQPGQPFWIKTIDHDAELMVTEHAKTLLSKQPSGKSFADYFKLSVTKGAVSDAAYIGFHEQASDDYDATFDMPKKNNSGMFNLSTIVDDNNEFAVNVLSSSFCEKEIYLNIEGVEPGDYEFTLQTPVTRNQDIEVTLHDHFLKTSVALTIQAITFKVTSDLASWQNRFSVEFRRTLDLDTPEPLATDACYGQTASFTIKNTQPDVEYFVLDGDGIIISNIHSQSDNSVSLSIAPERLRPGNNNYSIWGNRKNCASAMLKRPITIIYHEQIKMALDRYLQPCEGSKIEITATTNDDNLTYKWFQDGVQIPNESGSKLILEHENHPFEIYVEAHNANGCASQRDTVKVDPVVIDPVITVLANEMTVSVSGDEYQWVYNGQKLNGENSPQLVADQPGTYSIIVSKSGCSEESEKISYTPTSEEDISLDIYPNPSRTGKASLLISSHQPAPINVRIFTSSGQLIYEANDKRSSGTRELIFENILQRGIYTVVISQHNVSVQRKLVVTD